MFHESGGEGEFEDCYGWDEGERYFPEPTMSWNVKSKTAARIGGGPSDTSTPKTAVPGATSLLPDSLDASGGGLAALSTNQSGASDSGVLPKPTNHSSKRNARGGGRGRGRGRSAMSRDQVGAWSAEATTQEDARVALLRGNVGKISEFLESGLDPNTKLKSGWSLLMHACDKADDAMVEILLTQGADPNTQTDQFTALMAVCACKSKKEECILRTVQLLIDKKARVNSHDRHHMSPLLYAAQNGHGEVVSFLISSGADINKDDTQGWTSMFYAASRGDIPLMKVLLDAGANPAALCTHGETPSSVAYSNEHVAAADWLDSITSSAEKGAPPTVTRGIGSSSHIDGLATASARVLPKAVSADSCVHHGDIELFLAGIKLNELVPLFRQHQLQFSDLLSVTDKDLEQMGVAQVGVRKRLLDSILEVHKKEWDMPEEPFPTSKTLSAPNVAVILTNLARHTRYVRGTAAYLQQHLAAHPAILDPNTEPPEVDKITTAMAETVTAVSGLQGRVTNLQRSIHTAFRVPSGDSEQPGSGSVHPSPVGKVLRFVVVIGGLAVVGVAAYYSGRRLLSKLAQS